MGSCIATFDPIVDLKAVVINGRYVFAHGFLRALLEHGDLDAVWVYGDVGANREAAMAGGLEAHLGDRLRLRPAEACAELADREGLLALHTAMHKSLLLPGVRVRSLVGGRFPLTATVHGLAYPDTSATLLAHQVADLRAGDTLVCPSPTVARSLEVMQGQLTHPDLAPSAMGQVAIPHGCDRSRFRPRDRGEVRARLGLPAERPILLYVGRLHAQNKLDLAPVLRSLAPLWAGEGAPPPLLVLVVPEAGVAGDRLRLQARNLGVDLRLEVDPDQAALPLWYNATDVFLGLSDTLCEMFGLSVLEAMASGVACVVSDVGGYRHLVEDGVTGRVVASRAVDGLTRVSALAPHHAPMVTLARVNATTSIDGDGLLVVCRQLLADGATREALGQAATDAAEAYDWRHVISAYMHAWREAGDAATADEGGPRGADLIMPYFAAFGDAFTEVIDGQTRFMGAVSAPDFLSAWEARLDASLEGFISVALVAWMLSREGTWTCEELSGAPDRPEGADRERVLVAAAWALKQGVVRLADPASLQG